MNPDGNTVRAAPAASDEPDDDPALDTSRAARTDQLPALVVEHAAAAYRVAVSVVRDAARAEDVIQDTLIKAWGAWPTYQGEAPLRHWILRIAHNTAVSTLRARRDEVVDPATLPDPPTAISTEAYAEGRLALDALWDALGRLDETSRAMVVLRELEALSYDEIAAVLALPLSTVKTRLFRARRALVSELEDWRA